MRSFPNAQTGVANEAIDQGGHEDDGARGPVSRSLLRANFGPVGLIVEKITLVDVEAVVRSNHVEVVALEVVDVSVVIEIWLQRELDESFKPAGVCGAYCRLRLLFKSSAPSCA